MAITVKIKLSSGTAGNTVVFAETSAGHFTEAITSETAVSVTSSDKPLRAAAVSTVAGKYISSWNTSGTEDENLSSWTSSSSTAAYPRYSYTTSNGPDVTVVDDHGAHLGTPTGTGKYKSGNCVGVMHSTTDSGWTFTGWTVTLTIASESSTYGTMLSSGGTKSGSVYTFGATGEAIVFQLGSSAARTVTFTANYEATSEDCTVSFLPGAEDVVGGEYPTLSVSGGSSVTMPDPILWSRPGYDFAGWSTSAGAASATYAVGDSVFVAASTTFYAVWVAQTGEGGSPDSFTSCSNVSGGGQIKTNFTRYVSQYKFNVSTNVPDETPRLWCWTRGQGWRRHRKTYYNPNYSDGIDHHKDVDEMLQYASAPEQRYWDISGSRTSSDAVAGTAVNIPADYISWENTIDSNVNNAKTHDVESTTGATDIESDWTWTAPEIDGYVFDGWYTISQKWTANHTPTYDEFTVKIGGDRTIRFSDLRDKVNAVLVEKVSSYSGKYAYQYSYRYQNYVLMRYVVARSLVLFVADGASFATTTCTVGSSYVLPSSAPSKSGYAFAGWFTAESGGEQITATTNFTAASPVIAYAQWTSASIRLPFCIAEDAVGKLVLFAGQIDEKGGLLDQQATSSERVVFSASGENGGYLGVMYVQVVPLSVMPTCSKVNSGTRIDENPGRWSSWRGDYPTGTANEISISGENFPDETRLVTIQDEHGEHIGTQNCESLAFPTWSIVGVKHTSTNKGWKFLGWRLTGGSAYLGLPLPIDYWIYDDTTGEYFLPASVDSAIVYHLTRGSSVFSLIAVYEPDGPSDEGTGLMVRSASSDFLVFSASSGALVYDA